MSAVLQQLLLYNWSCLAADVSVDTVDSLLAGQILAFDASTVRCRTAFNRCNGANWLGEALKNPTPVAALSTAAVPDSCIQMLCP